MRFLNRFHAGRVLGAALIPGYGGRCDAVVLALPRGGVPVGYEAALALGCPLDVFVVRKLGVPGQPELAMGAIAAGGVRVVNDSVVRGLDISEETLNRVTREEATEVARRERLYRGDLPQISLEGRVAILVDDGLATGSTMRAAIAAVRGKSPASVVVAVPVAAESTIEDLRPEADQIVCLETPEPFYAVGLWYEDFRQVNDGEVRVLLGRSRRDGRMVA